MSTEKKILFDIQVKTDSANKRIADLTLEERKLSGAIKELSKDYEKNAESIVKMETQLRSVKKEKSTIVNLMDKEVAANKANEASMDALTAQLVKLTSQYDKLSTEEKQNSEEGKKLIEQMRLTREELTIIEEKKSSSAKASDEEAKSNKAVAGSYAEIQLNIKNYREQLNNLVIGSKEYLLVQDKLNQELEKDQQAKKQMAQLSKTAEGSNDELKKQIILLTKEYDALSKEQRENSEEGKALTKRIKELSDELKENKKAIGDNRLEVGNYKDALKEAIAENGGFAGSIKGAIVENTKFGESVKTVGVAFKTNPIGFFVSMLISLVSILKENTKVMDFFNRTFGILNTVVTAVTGKIVDFGDSLVAALENPKQLMVDFGNFIKENIENRFKAVGVILESIKNFSFDDLTGSVKNVTNGFLQASTGVENFIDKTKGAISATGDFAKEIYNQADALNKVYIERKNLEKEEILALSRSKQMLAEEERIKNIRDNEFNSIEVRIKANAEARKIEEERLKVETDLARRKFENLETEIKLLGEANISNEKLKEREEARLALADILEDSLGKQNEFITERYGLEQERIEKNRELQQKAINEEIAGLEIKLLKVKKNSEEELKIREEIISKQRDLSLTEEGVTETQKKLIILKSEEEISNARKEFAFKSQKELLELSISLAKQGSEEEMKAKIELLKVEAAFEMNQTETTAAQKKILEERLQKDILQLKIEYAQRNLQDEITSLNRQLAIFKNNKEKQLQIQEDILKRQAALELENANLTAEQKLEIEKKLLSELEQLQFEAASSRIQRIEEQENLRLEERLNERLVTQSEYERQVQQLSIESTEKQIEAARKSGEDTLALERELVQKKISLKQFEVSQTLQQQEEAYQFTKSSVEGLSGILSLAARDSAQAAEFEKTLAVTQIAIDTAKAISDIITVATGSGDAVASGGLSIPIKIAALSATVIANFAKVKEMLNQDIPQPGFYTGGEFIYNSTSNDNSLSKDNLINTVNSPAYSNTSISQAEMLEQLLGITENGNWVVNSKLFNNQKSTTNPYFSNSDRVTINGESFGYTGDGNPREESKAVGSRPYSYHKRELIVNHETLATPEGAYYGRQLLQLMKKDGGKVKSLPGFYDGGLAVRMATANVDAQLGIATAGTGMVKEAFDNVNIEVAVTDIEKKQDDRKRVRAKGLR